jgi:GT2 family glycosyltransferase
MTKATAILLNYQRPENMVKVIASVRMQQPAVDIWLWNNNPKDARVYDVDEQFNASSNFVCWPRWLMAGLVKSKYIFTLDDDLMFTDVNIIQDCVDYMESNKVDIIGYIGVQLKGGNYWTGNHIKAGGKDHNVDVVKGRFAFMRTALLDSVSILNERQDDVKICGAAKILVVPAFLEGRFEQLPEGNEAFCAAKDHKQSRQEAVERWIK